VSAPGVAVFGAGRMGTLHAGNLARGVGGFRLEVMADPDPATRSRVADLVGAPVTADWQSTLGDPGIAAVFVCSTTAAHHEQVIASLEAGKQVFCEKPLAGTLRETDDIVAALTRSDSVLQVGFQRRFDPHVRALADAVRVGRLGRPLLVRVSSRDPAPPPPDYPRSPGGIFIDSTIHDFDVTRFLLDDEVEEVTSMGSSLVDPVAAAAGDHDTAVTLLRFASGALGAVDNCRLAAQGYDQRVEVHGSAGMASVGNPEPLAFAVADTHGSHRPPPPYFFVERYAVAYAAEVEAFRVALDGGPVAATAADGRAALRLALAAARSVEERRPVRVEEVLPT